ncbi:MAG TPA: hypothetical protein VFJ16_19210 [Longimicrobium sp.]|nr:hypothetical protein [Longimicrobium sp.]
MKRILGAAGFRFVVAAQVVWASACAGGERASERPVVSYTAVERARSDSAAQLEWGYSLDVDSRGNIFVADPTAFSIFSPDGRFLRHVGRPGAGPGEFDYLRTVNLLPGDSVYAFDAGNSRVTVFEPGTWRTAYTLQVGRDQLFAPRMVRPVLGGRAISARIEAAYGDYDGRTPNRRRLAVMRLLNADGSVRRDSVLAFAEREMLILHNPEGVAPNPFGRTTNLAFVGDDRMITQWSDSLKFDIYSVDGRHLKTVRPEFSPPRRSITPGERDSVVAELGDALVPAASVRRAIDEHGATTWPLAQGMVVDDQDRVWLGITGLRGEPTHWTAFDLEGRRVARVDLPANAALRLVRGNTAYTVAKDGDDVPRVVVYELRSSSTLAMNRR